MKLSGDKENDVETETIVNLMFNSDSCNKDLEKSVILAISKRRAESETNITEAFFMLYRDKITV